MPPVPSEFEPTSGEFPAGETKVSQPCTMGQFCGLWCVAGLDGYFKRLSPAWALRLGWTEEELLARPFVDFVHPEDRAATLADLGKLKAGAETIAFENRYAHRDGSYHWLQWHALPLPGQPLVQATARDVTEQRRLEKEIVEISDREKDRLGRDLHDSLCQNLAGIAALTTALSRRLATHDQAAAAAAVEIGHLLKTAIIETRNLARGLNPVELTGSGLVGALDEFAVNIQARFRISCVFHCNHPSFRLGATVETHLYRIVQESVQNAISHGRANQVTVTLRFEEAVGTLMVQDDGIGIPTDACHGKGMHTMAYRARLIGASLWVRPDVGSGTRVDCVFGVSSSPSESASHG